MKIGYFNFWDGFEPNIFFKIFGNALAKHGISYTIHDCMKEECDIVFFSVFGLPNNFNLVKGRPILIYYTGEASKMNSYYASLFDRADLCMTFFDDSDKNLFLPYWQVEYDAYRLCKPTMNRDFNDKKRFCSFVYRHAGYDCIGSKMRADFFYKMNETYKKVDSLGSWNNNTPEIVLPKFNEDNLKAQSLLKQYKFTICFENNPSAPNESYITEKMPNGYVFGAVPVYWGGGDRLNEFFNEKAFINCNGKSVDEIADIVKYYDTHDDEYKQMLNQNLFINDIDYKEYSYDRIFEFLKKHDVL